MKKNKIAARLTLYFTISLLLFSILVGGVFAWMFGRYSTELHRNELEQRATRIANALAGFSQDNRVVLGSGHGHGGGSGAYLSFLDDIAMADVWVVDRQSNQVTSNHHGGEVMSYRELPEGAEQVIERVLTGDVAFSESFSDLLEQPSLTVGAPITSPQGLVIGAALLHSPIDGQEAARKNQVRIMALSIVFAMLLSIPVARWLSLRFTGPLSRMTKNALRLAEGDYTAHNQINQRDEIGELAANMDILADRLEEARRERDDMEQARREFFSNVSHELRTPVTVMRGSLEALCDGVVCSPEQVEEYHRQMLSESMHMQRLVNDLLELSRLQSPDFQMELSRVNLLDVVEDVSRSMRRVADQKQVSILLEELPEGASIRGDYSRIRQMLMAVVDNAVKFSPSGGTVRLRGWRQQEEFRLSVTDHGDGIPPEELPKLFERFHKGQPEHNRQGTGLGLAIAREIASRHGVTISAESQPGETTFTIAFALSEGAEAQ